MPVKFNKLPNLSDRDIERFWSKISKLNSCWEWTGRMDKNNSCYLDWSNGRAEKLSLLAERVSYAIHNEEPPTDKTVAQTCGNKKCVNPAHLKLADSIYKSNYQKGDKIGELIFVNRVDKNPDKPYANFLCECGKEFVTRIDAVKSGRTKSCGCKTKIFISEASAIHDKKVKEENGMVKLPTLRQEDKDRFWSKVNCDSNAIHCWEWTGATNGRYGYFSMGAAGGYKSNRLAYHLHYEKEIGSLHVLHTCDNPKCCNPHHLYLGTHRDNMDDMVDRKRARNQYTGKNEEFL